MLRRATSSDVLCACPSATMASDFYDLRWCQEIKQRDLSLLSGNVEIEKAPNHHLVLRIVLLCLLLKEIYTPPAETKIRDYLDAARFLRAYEKRRQNQRIHHDGEPCENLRTLA